MYSWNKILPKTAFCRQWDSDSITAYILRKRCDVWRNWGNPVYSKCNNTRVCFIYTVPVLWLEKAMALHSSTLAWKIPWTEEPGRLQSMGSLRVRHDWVTSLSIFTFLHWRRKWQPTPVFLPGESQGRRSLVGCSLWGRIELDTTEAT